MACLKKTEELKLEASEGQKKANKVAVGGDESSLRSKNITNKEARTKFLKNEKSLKKKVVTQEVLRKNLQVSRRHQNWLQNLAAK